MQLTEYDVGQRIHVVRNVQVILDSDLARFYEIEPKYLNRIVKRNPKSFPEDFAFQLTIEEWNKLDLGNVIPKFGGRRFLPYGFTLEGVVMLSGKLKSDQAAAISVSIFRVFRTTRFNLEQEARLASRIDRFEREVIKRLEESTERFDRLLPSEPAALTTPAAKPRAIVPRIPRNQNLARIGATLDSVSMYFNVSANDLVANSRVARLVLPRQIGMYMAHRLQHISLEEVGLCFGGRNHSTVIHAVRKIERAIQENNQDICTCIEKIRQNLS